MNGNKIGVAIRSIRISKGITATFMANKLGYKAVSSYIRLEKVDGTPVTLEQAKTIADTLGVDINEFFYAEKLRETRISTG